MSQGQAVDYGSKPPHPLDALRLSQSHQVVDSLLGDHLQQRRWGETGRDMSHCVHAILSMDSYLVTLCNKFNELC